MLSRYHLHHNNSIIWSFNADYEENAVWALKGYAKHYRIPHQELSIYKEGTNTPLNPDNYDLKYFHKHRKPKPQHVE